jgi:hypothetical protein
MKLQLFAGGALAHLGLAPEVAWGTPLPAANYLPIISESWTTDIEQIMDEGLRGRFAAGDQYPGLHSSGGDIVFDVRPISIGHILRAVLGPPTTSGVASAYTHTFVPRTTDFSADCPLNPVTLEINRDLGQAHQYAGAVFNSLRLEFGAAQKLLRATVNGFSKGKPTLIAKTAPTYETVEPFKWRQLAFKLGDTLAGAAALAYLESFGMTITNNVAGTETAGGAATDAIGRVDRTGLRVVDVQMTLAISDLVEHNKFLASNDRAVDLTFSMDANTSLQIKLPRVRYEAFPVNVGGPGRYSIQVTGKAKFDATAQHDVQVVLKNSQATY